MKKYTFLLTLLSIVNVLFLIKPVGSQSSTADLVLLDRQDQSISSLTDGDAIRLRLTLAETANAPARVAFSLDGSEPTVSECSLSKGENRCETALFPALGWYWTAGGAPRKSLSVKASVEGMGTFESAPVSVASRPVVMVHGFSSSWEAWENYLGPQGYLASQGLRGFAVGDDQVEGTMNTGRLDQPKSRTNTIAENAAILGRYIENVKKVTRAQKVDLVAHSMGGLIARYYIDRLMKEEDVAQLILLGSPMAGTQCANLPASLGFYLPAALEIQPSYVEGVFNQQITHRHGVPFYALAGIPISDAIQSPCTPVPTDLAVSFESVTAIPLKAQQMPILHMNLNLSQEVFERYVLPLLQTPPGQFASDPDPAVPGTSLQTLQFSRLYNGNIPPGSGQELVIHIDPGVTVASFALFDPSRSLAIEVRGANGNVINLNPTANGLIEVDDPSALFQLGYGFNNPKPGIWKVTLRATEKTPAAGADYALTASFKGGAALEAHTSLLLPRVGESVRLEATLSLDGKSLPVEQAQAAVRAAGEATDEIPLTQEAGHLQGDWKPGKPGLYGIEIQVTGRLPDGGPVERVSELTVEVQPEPVSFRLPAVLLIAVAGLVLVAFLGFILLVLVFWRWRNRSRS